MKFFNFGKIKGQKYNISGICDFCKKPYIGPVIISTNTYNRQDILERSEFKGSVFLWNNPGPTKQDIIDFLSGKEFLKIKYISKLLIRLRGIKDIRIRFGFPRIMLTCNKCFRKKGK